MGDISTIRFDTPGYLVSSYNNIRNSKLITEKKLTEESVAEFQKYLNEAQPENATECNQRSLVQFLYRKNPMSFCKFLVKSRVNHLILWTESKYIARHFGLQGVVYIKWNENKYECSMHNNCNNNTQGDVEDSNSFKSFYNQYNKLSTDAVRTFGNVSDTNNLEFSRRYTRRPNNYTKPTFATN